MQGNKLMLCVVSGKIQTWLCRTVLLWLFAIILVGLADADAL